MDLHKAIRELLAERERIDQLISMLEEMVRDQRTAMDEPKRRGRKGMTAEERRKVSERMRKYWASRRTS